MVQLQGARFIWFGNSQSTPDYAAPWWGETTIDLLRHNGYAVRMANTSVSGQTSRQILNKLSNDLATHHIIGANNIAIVQEGTNDLLYLNDEGVVNLVDRAEQGVRCVCQTLKSAGYFVIVVGSVPRGHGYGSGDMTPARYLADMLALDALVETNHRQYAHLFWNVRKACPEYDPLSLVYSGDIVHQSAHGHQLMGSRFALFLMAQVNWQNG